MFTAAATKMATNSKKTPERRFIVASAPCHDVPRQAGRLLFETLFVSLKNFPIVNEQSAYFKLFCIYCQYLKQGRLLGDLCSSAFF